LNIAARPAGSNGRPAEWPAAFAGPSHFLT
jgi:hypothetical protein